MPATVIGQGREPYMKISPRLPSIVKASPAPSKQPPKFGFVCSVLAYPVPPLIFLWLLSLFHLSPGFVLMKSALSKWYGPTHFYSAIYRVWVSNCGGVDSNKRKPNLPSLPLPIQPTCINQYWYFNLIQSSCIQLHLKPKMTPDCCQWHWTLATSSQIPGLKPIYLDRIKS